MIIIETEESRSGRLCVLVLVLLCMGGIGGRRPNINIIHMFRVSEKGVCLVYSIVSIIDDIAPEQFTLAIWYNTYSIHHLSVCVLSATQETGYFSSSFFNPFMSFPILPFTPFSKLFRAMVLSASSCTSDKVLMLSGKCPQCHNDTPSGLYASFRSHQIYHQI